MNAMEIMEALIKGEKITCNFWSRHGEYVCLDSLGRLVDEAGDEMTWGSLDSDEEYYVLKHPAKFVWSYIQYDDDCTKIYHTLLSQEEAKDVFAGFYSYEQIDGPYVGVSHVDQCFDED